MSAAKCFYPDGSPSLEQDIPCSNGVAVACCPEKWSCQPNGLCYYDKENYYGRYTCTDKSWGPGCPDICTYDHTAGGNEAVLECTTGSYCCDTNRPELSGGTNCCEAQSNRFSLNGNIQVNTTSDSTSSLTETPYSIESPMPSTTKNTRPEPSMSTETHFPAENPVPSATEDTDLEPSMSTSTLADQASTSLVCNSGLGEIRCGSICCKEFQFCAYFGQCSDIGGASESSTSLAVPEYTIPTIVGTSQDSIQTTSILASISPYPRQGSPSYSVAITPSAPANTTSVAVSANSTMPTSRATSSSSVTHTVGFKAGVIVGAVVFFIIAIIVAIYGWRRYKKDAFKTKIEEDTSNIEPPPAHPFTMTNPPSPNPYRQPFPLVPSFTDERSSANNRSRYNDNLVPDQDQEQYRSQPNIRYAPPLNPYAAFQRNHDQERHNS